MRCFLSTAILWMGFALLSVSQACAADQVRAVSRFEAPDNSPTYYCLRLELDNSTPPIDVWTSAAGDRGDVWLFVHPKTEDAADQRTHWLFMRARGAPPRSHRLRIDKRWRNYTVDWSSVTVSDATLPDRWREAAHHALETLDMKNWLPTGFARYALTRLFPTDRPGDSTRSPLWNNPAGRFRNASTFDLTTGATAIEESLQLERLLATPRVRGAADIPLSSVEGVTIKSHPWLEMIGDKKPSGHAIERFLPLDQYAFEAASFGELIELADWLDAWGSPLLHFAEERADDSGVKARIEQQLCLPASVIARTIGPLVIGRVAMTGGDPFLREGADVTLVFELKAPPVFAANLEQNRLEALVRRPDAQRTEASHGIHKITGVVTSDRSVSSYSAQIDAYALVANSLVGLKRSLDAFDAKIQSQKDGLDRRYVRTLLPSSNREGAFLFLSDDFIRRLVGPGSKLRESRRLECSTSLRTIAQATAWREMRGEANAATLATLVESQDLPVELLYCPDGGQYALNADGRAGACSVHGTLEFLTPNAELALEFITAEERQAYETFRTTYQNYWSRFFDPIGIQISLGKVKRFETVILPLIEMSEYRDLADLCGGDETQEGPLHEVGPSTVLHMSAHVNRDGRLFRRADDFSREMLFGGMERAALSWVGERVSLFVEDSPLKLNASRLTNLFPDMLDSLWKGAPGGIRIGVKNPLLLAGFLAAIKALITSSAPDAARFETLPERSGVSLVRVSTEMGREMNGPEALFYGTFGGGLYLAFGVETLNNIIDRVTRAKGEPKPDSLDRPQESPPTKPAVAPTWIDGSHVALSLALANAPIWQQQFVEMFDQVAVEMCAQAVARRELLERFNLRDAPSQRTLNGNTPRCPAGGTLAVATAGCVTCSVHDAPAADIAARSKNPLRTLDAARAKITFTADGIRSVLEIESKE